MTDTAVRPLMVPFYPDGAAVLGGMSRSVLYQEAKAGRLATVKVGRRTYIAMSELERYVAALAGDMAGDAS